MARSNYTPDQLIALVPTDVRDIPACSEWYSYVYKWAEIERAENIKNRAWLALQQLESLSRRQDAIDVIIGDLNAYRDVQCTEQPTPDPDPANPSKPSITEQATSLNITWPTDTSTAGDPVLPDRTGINPT